ncbi:CheY-like chemotaxis protein [Sinorhizobium fredii]|jgi:CheY-like chemotaxis protein|uniref:Putative two-component response regulator protein n=1 Tax=Sinorhizobium fredii (strain USDA 257) TaxID=1185652 RepID=I3XC79_SINF2|nr:MULTISPECIES: response regulator [Sinorhizobium]AFL53485.1 putative two-component response regulator protein [Sinorhizobium fredii USDA 257]PDT84600.1 response regulator [Sinorhizobium sp. BJ1]
MMNQISPTIRSVLVVEDNFLIAMDMEEILGALGVTSVHIATTTEKAMEIVGAHPIDFAILDINLGDETSFAVAESLIARGINFGFTSGYGDLLALPGHLRDIPRIEKPFSEGSLSSLIAAAFRPGNP